MLKSRPNRTPKDDSAHNGELLRRAREFDPSALTEIYQVYQEPLYRYIYHHTGHTQTAEDLTAEAFRRLLVALRAGRGPDENFKAWMYRVAHNLVVDELRRRNYRDHQPLEQAPVEALCDHQQNPEERAWTSLAGAHVREALGELTPDQRQVIVLKFLEGMSNAEVARITGRSVGAVKALQHRALESLRDRLVSSAQLQVTSPQRAAAYGRL
jgi:RNA polymerase sigma-70 factor (ECF subfamily)